MQFNKHQINVTMRKLVFIAIIASLAMTGCIQKESEKKEGSSDKKVLTENVKLATCNINVGGIRFTKSKNGGENGITLLGDTLKFVAGPQTDYSAPRMEALSIALQSFLQKLTTLSLSLSRLKYSQTSPKLEHIRQVCYTHTRMTLIVKNCVSNRMNMVFTVWCQFAQ